MMLGRLIPLMLIVNTWLAPGGSHNWMDCTKDADCPAPLICNMKDPRSAFCDCNPDSQIWSTDLGQCVGLVNATCTINSRNNSCIENAICTDARICQCISPSHSATPDRTCMVNYDFPCENNCNPELFLSCMGNKRCGCKFQFQMRYEAEVGECRMLPEEPCGPANGLFHHCVSGAECLPLSRGSIFMQCRCEPGRVFDPASRDCLPSYGATCRSTADCDSAKSMVCTIQNDGTGHCGCLIGTQWDENDQECKVLPGESCRGVKQCVKKATCSTSKLCECDHGFSVNRRTRSCVPTYGTLCDNTSLLCNEESKLRCHSETGTCQCMEGHEWSESQQHCISLVNSTCGQFQPCTEMAFCNQHEVCECFPTYSVTPAGKCLLAFGSPCISTGCNVYEFLECKHEACQCQGFALPEEQLCKSYVGGPCGLMNETMTSIECYEGTTCVYKDKSSSGTCHLSPDSKIYKLKSSSVTLYILIIVTVFLFIGLLIYLPTRKWRRRLLTT